MTWLLRVLSLGLWKPKPDLRVRAYIEGSYTPPVGLGATSFGEFTTFASTEAEAKRIEKTLAKIPGVENLHRGNIDSRTKCYLVGGRVINLHDIKFCENHGIINNWFWSDNDEKICRQCREPVQDAIDLPEKEVIKRVQEHDKSQAA